MRNELKRDLALYQKRTVPGNFVTLMIQVMTENEQKKFF
jgi:hypothetical protein